MAVPSRPRILLLNPNSSTGMTHAMELAAKATPVSDLLDIDTYTAPAAAPASIDSRADLAASAAAVLADAPQLDAYDAVLVACFSVHSLVAALAARHPRLAVTGIFEASVLTALSLVPVSGPEHWGIVTTGDFWETHLADGIGAFLGRDGPGHDTKFCVVCSTGLTAGDLHALSPDDVRTRLEAATRRLLGAGDVSCVVMGCGAMAGLQDVIRSAAREAYGHERADSLDLAGNGSDPMDCWGHGTTVAGVVAAQASGSNGLGVSGVAPGVSLGAYRVYGCGAGAALPPPTDLLVGAWNAAFDDGAHVISSSIGYLSGWPQDAVAAAVEAIVARGVACVGFAGNSGRTGFWTTAAPSDAAGAFAVASVFNAAWPAVGRSPTYSVDGGGAEVPFAYRSGWLDAWHDSELRVPLYATSLDAGVSDDACDQLPDATPDLAGTIVLIRKGGCPVANKAYLAAKKGARRVLFYNDAPGPDVDEVRLGGETHIRDAGMVTARLGESWDGRLASGGYVPEGRYKLVVRSLRIFGDADKESDCDVIETKSLTIP